MFNKFWFEAKNINCFKNGFRVIKDLNLEIAYSENVILIGPNGSGKSTLLGLIAGVFYSQEGKVYANNKQFGYIGATPMIFTGTLKENLMYGNDTEVDDKTILNYLKDFDWNKPAVTDFGTSFSTDLNLGSFTKPYKSTNYLIHILHIKRPINQNFTIFCNHPSSIKNIHQILKKIC